jgi:hypothetical protein
MQLNRPKALLEVNGEYLLAYTLDGLIVAGMTPILVVTDRAEWLDRIQAYCTRFAGPVVRLCSSATSTLAVACEVAPFMASRFFFVYGHAPRPAAHYRAMWECSDKVVVTRTGWSSKRKCIPSPSSQGFVEPPYLLDRHSVLETGAEDWTSFFDDHRADSREVSLDGPGEFNYGEEYREYKAYVETLWHSAELAGRERIAV